MAAIHNKNTKPEMIVRKGLWRRGFRYRLTQLCKRNKDMALAINIEDLLNKQKIESNRIEFKKGWNPASIYHSVCAFANDFDDLGGGYILVGVDSDDDTGMAIRPVEGVPIGMWLL